MISTPFNVGEVSNETMEEKVNIMIAAFTTQLMELKYLRLEIEKLKKEVEYLRTDGKVSTPEGSPRRIKI